MTCVHCQTEIADRALICYRCGRPTVEPRVKPPAEQSLFTGRRRARLPLVWAAVIVAAAALLLWRLLMIGE